MSIECLCVKRGKASISSHGGVIRAKISCAPACVTGKFKGAASIKANNRRERNGSVKITAEATITGGQGIESYKIPRTEKPRIGLQAWLGGRWSPPDINSDQWTPPQFKQTFDGGDFVHLGKKLNHVGEGVLTPGLSVIYGLRRNISAGTTLRSPYTDKFAGDFSDFGCAHKLYPTKDIDNSWTGGYIVDETNDSGNLYQSVNEGLFTGSYHTNFGQSLRLSDDRNTFIQPSAVYTDGTFRYKCEVTNPSYTAKHSRLYLRASAPRHNYSSDTPPKYKIQDIKFEDPSGNLIIKYEDIILRGDSDYSSYKYLNFATYGSKPEKNNLLLHTWQSGYPYMEEGSGYTLSFQIDVECLDDPFDVGFGTGFQENCELLEAEVPHSGNDYLALDGSPLATQTQRLSYLNPTNTIRISAIEICNSGGFETVREDYLPIHFGVQASGRRIEQCILPKLMPTYGYGTDSIYPAASSVWRDANGTLTNQSGVGAGYLTSLVANESSIHAITMDSTSPVADSGKLFLEFRSTPPKQTTDWRGGDFDIGYLTNDFSVARQTTFTPEDHTFEVDEIRLDILAKKKVGSRDYALDVVGWSDDKLLNVTSSVGGFLQNRSGDNNFDPISSGFNATDELALGGEALSDKHQYYKTSGTNNDGGDHYILTNTPLVTSTAFQWYEIPLKIYEDTVEVGKSPAYNQSSFFEKLFLDIFPFPSGATIAAAKLCVKYKPQNSINLHTLGYEKMHRINNIRAESKIRPSVRSSTDDILNAGSGLSSLSAISNIPHGYKTPNDIKSNYSRRWRGIEGIVQGPFDPDEFNFGFNNPLLDYPFLSGFYNFSNNSYDLGIAINSIPLGSGFGNTSGIMNTTYDEYLFHNIGWRFNDSGIFSQQLPGLSSSYRTTDWTSLSNGSFDFTSDPLYGNIADAFDRAIRVSGSNSYVDFGHIDTTSGFSIYTRFTPDASVSGVGYNLFESGVIFSKWDASKDLDFALGYEGGYLCGYAKDIDDNTIKVKDTIKYSAYQYPLSVILTYNDHQSSGLKLYTDNEIHSGVFNTKRAESSAFYKKSGDSKLILGNSFGSGVGMNMFVTEFGIGTWHDSEAGSGCHIVESSPDLTVKEVTADNFLRGNRVKFWASGEPASNDRYGLWDYVNEDTLDWDLGAFKVCEFSPDFDFLTKRVGRDLISTRLIHDGSGYTQRVNLTVPASVNHSGLAYHTQIENDFLRFNLSDASDNFYTANHPRITKDLPRGYKFADRAFVVETILEHETQDLISWPDGNLGPKLIVSLYTKNQEPVSYPTENWGLINRDIHYLKPSGCWRRIDSTFTYDNFFDESEAWALFPQERRLTEFNKKYYSQDVNDMFLQYDLVYPSGSAFDSRINIHSAHVRLEDAFVSPTQMSGEVPLTVSGELRPREILPMHSISICHISNRESGVSVCEDILGGSIPSGLCLYTEGPFYVDNLTTSSGMVMYTSGNIWSSGNSSLALLASGKSLGSVGGAGTDGSIDDDFVGLNLYVSGMLKTNEQLPLSLLNDQTTITYPYPTLNLNTHASQESRRGSFGYVPLYLKQHEDIKETSSGTNLNLFTYAIGVTSQGFSQGFIGLITAAPQTVSGTALNLTLYNQVNLVPNVTSGNFSLHTTTHGAGNTAELMRWSNYNYGHEITIDDNNFATLDADDEIRGVDLICSAACDASGTPNKCNEKEIYTHNVVWRGSNCVDGGIFRPRATYTNLSTQGFNTDVGYSGHFYGIRKYTHLAPNSPYYLTMKGTTGSTKTIPVGRDFEEWEYGSVDDVQFSGNKFIADYPYMSGQKSLTAPSGRTSGDWYGKSVALTSDIMVVGAPLHEFDEMGGTTYFDSGNNRLEWIGASGLYEAGAMFLYRRGEQPQSPNMHPSGHKASWTLESKIVLPSAYRGDWFHTHEDVFSVGGMPALPVRQWHIGQEGRRLGHSVGVGSTTNNPSLGESKREVVVVGAPRGHWNRKFDNVVTTPIKVAVMVFSDEFVYNEKKAANILAKQNRLNEIFKYYSADPRHLEINVLIYEPTGVASPNSDISKKTAPWIHHDQIPRNTYSHGVVNNTLSIQSGITDLFHKAFPYDASLPLNGLPPVVGFYVDDSRSLGREEVEPAIDNFVDYYKWYSHASGVQDVYGVVDSGHIHEYKPSRGAAEDWLWMSNTLIDSLLDSGRLIKDNGLRFITSGVGPEFQNPNLTEFNRPPASGGRAYIFEKESGVWNLIQEISRKQLVAELDGGSAGQQEDDPFYDDAAHYQYDSFGHAVAISENTEVISIGSPYSDEACVVFEHDPHEKSRLYRHVPLWLKFKSTDDSYYETIYTRWEGYERSLGDTEASKKIYLELTPSDKFSLRSDPLYWDSTQTEPIREYRKVYQYGYSNIGHRGTWQFIPSIYAPTSRLGWSTSVSEDGDMVVFGAPTDSFNEFDDTNVYYKPNNTWASYVNAGAVRVFESRKYHPHSGVVEFYKFGNLDESRRAIPDRDEDYSDIKHTFETQGVPFRRTGFSEVEIPKSAGLAFIITPEIDAASDEVIENIKDWLALGDRTLVLVGNDPEWEGNRAYKQSNEIVNKILSKLSSRMRIHPARNEFESLPGCAPSGKPNILPSYRPVGGRITNINTPKMFGKGVGDIRMHIPAWSKLNSPCNDLNDKCELPLDRYGDLRAEWQSECTTNTPKCDRSVKYKTNWPLHFGTVPWPCDTQCSPDPRAMIGPNEEPKPLLVAAEEVPEKVTIYPAWEECWTETIYCRKWVNDAPLVTWKFGDPVGDVQFAWSEKDTNYTSSDRAKYIDPPEYEDRDALIMAEAVSRDDDPPIRSYENIYPESTIMAKENWSGNSTSKVVMIAGVTSESESNLIQGAYDYNISFYLNLVGNGCNSETLRKGSVVQLGGWTKRTSFRDAYKASCLGSYTTSDGKESNGILRQYGNVLIENFVVEETEREGKGIDDTHNVCWIANAKDVPTAEDIKDIKEWMDKGNKTLVITYANSMSCDMSDEDCPDPATAIAPDRVPPSQKYARVVERVCDKLGINMRPAYLPGEGRYAEFQLDTGSGGRQYRDNDDSSIKGCKDSHLVGRLNFGNEDKDDDIGPNFIPINRACVQNGETWTDCKSAKVVWYAPKIRDIRWTPASPYWQIKPNLATLEVPVIKNSGYRIYYSWVSEFPDEDREIRAWAYGINTSPNPQASSPEDVVLYNYDNDDKKTIAGTGEKSYDLVQTGLGDMRTSHVDLRSHDSDSIKFYFDASNLRAGKTSEIKTKPKTVRLVGVSGVFIPIEKKITPKGRWVQYECGEVKKCKIHPERREVIPAYMRPIMTDNTKYCVQKDVVKEERQSTAYERFMEAMTSGPAESKGGNVEGSCSEKSGKLIADGPVVAAEEPEHFSVFPAGHNRSNIILLSDSSLIQGDCGWYRETPSNAFNKQPNRDFIYSLYPTIFKRGGPSKAKAARISPTSIDSKTEGRDFRHIKKLMAPDRGSPHKYWAASGLQGSIDNFLADSPHGTRAALSEFTDQEHINPNDVSRPPNPKTGEQIKKEIERFRDEVIPPKGAWPKFSGVVEGVPYQDPGPGGGTPNIVQDLGYDFLDFHRLPSGYPGDLFGYSVSIYSGKLVVGTPFNAFVSISGDFAPRWSEIQASNPESGLKLSQNGGAGAAYYFERTGKGSGVYGEYEPWEFMQKIKPSSINVGMDTSDITTVDNPWALGSNSYLVDDLSHNTRMTDRFGYDVSIQSDFIAVGTPGHDFENHHEHIYDSGSFLRKEFCSDFDIPLHNVYNLGESGLRNSMDGSGTAVLNNGAVFTFNHEIIDWPNRTKKWVLAEKVVGQGHNSRKQKSYIGAGLTPSSGAENDHFGESVALSRAFRTDSDYTMVVGSPHHMFASSGNHTTDQPLPEAGAAYSYDAMVRPLNPSTVSSGNWIMADLFGETTYISKENNKIHLNIQQNQSGDPVSYLASGTVWTNDEGELFLEASGQDPKTRSFIEHRCFIELVEGYYLHGTPVKASLNLLASGQGPVDSGELPLYITGPDRRQVYNNMGLYSSAVLGYASGVPSGLFLYSHSPAPIAASGGPSGMFLYSSGTGFPTSIIPLRIRGK